MIIARSSEQLLESTCNKIALFCHVSPTNVISVHDVSNVYHVPLILRDQAILAKIQSHLHFPGFEGKVWIGADWSEVVTQSSRTGTGP